MEQRLCFFNSFCTRTSLASLHLLDGKRCILPFLPHVFENYQNSEAPDMGLLPFLPCKKQPTPTHSQGHTGRVTQSGALPHGHPEEAVLGAVLTTVQTAQTGLAQRSLGACWGSNPVFQTSVFTTCSLTEGGFFLPSSRKITHCAFLLITAVLLPGSQNHYRSCNICHS